MNSAAVFVIVFLVIVCLKAAKTLLIPLTLGFLVAFLLTVPVKALRRIGIWRSIAVLLVELLTVGAVGSTLWLGLTQITDFTDQSPQIVEQFEKKLVSFKEEAGTFMQRVERNLRPRLPAPPRRLPAAETSPQPPALDAHSLVAPVMSLLQSLGVVLADLVVTLLLVVVLSFFFLLSWDELGDRLFLLAGEERLVTTMLMLQEAATGVRRYVLLNFLVNISFGAVIGVVFALFGIPQPILWGFLVALLRFLPSIGIIIGMLPPMLLSFAMNDGWSQPLLLAFVAATLDLCTANFVEPMVYGSRIGVSAIAIILSAVFWTWCWGPVGLLVAPPLTVCLVVLGRYIPSLRFFSVLFGETSGSEISYRFFHRLLSSDPADARAMITEARKSVDDVEVFDLLFLPALVVAEQDLRRRTLSEENYRNIVEKVRLLLAEMQLSGEEEKLSDPPAGGNVETPVLIVPLKSQAEYLCAEMLAACLRRRQVPVTVVSETALLGEALDEVKNRQPRTVFFSAIIEANGVSVRYLLKRLEGFDRGDTRFLLGRWGGVNGNQTPLPASKVTIEQVGSIRDALRRVLEYQQADPGLAEQGALLAA